MPNRLHTLTVSQLEAQKANRENVLFSLQRQAATFPAPDVSEALQDNIARVLQEISDIRAELLNRQTKLDIGIKEVPQLDVSEALRTRFEQPSSLVGASRHFLGDLVSYSGCDIIPVITTPLGQMKAIGNIQGLSYSIHRAKPPVKVLGRSYPKSYARGSRTIAGSLVWLVLDQAALSELTGMYDFEMASDTVAHTMVPDQLPPFDITITYWSEVPGHGGHFRGSYLKLYGIDIVDEGQTHSMNDVYSENVMQFVARDIEHMTPTDDFVEGHDGSFKRVAPFERALFQTRYSTPPTIDTELAEDIKELERHIQAASEQLSHLIDVLRAFDTRMDRTITTTTDRTGTEYTRDQLYDKIKIVQKEIADGKAARKAGLATQEQRLTDTRIKNLSDHTKNFRDSPFDTVSVTRF
jgi:hypothetical protein